MSQKDSESDMSERTKLVASHVDNNEDVNRESGPINDTAVTSTPPAEPPYPQRERKAPVRLTISSLRKIRHDDKPMTCEALKREEAIKLREAIQKEIKTLDDMMCCVLINPPKDEKILHRKYVLKRKRNSAGGISKPKARFVVCGNEERNEDEVFFPVADFTVV